MRESDLEVRRGETDDGREGALVAAADGEPRRVVDLPPIATIAATRMARLTRARSQGATALRINILPPGKHRGDERSAVAARLPSTACRRWTFHRSADTRAHLTMARTLTTAIELRPGVKTAATTIDFPSGDHSGLKSFAFPSVTWMTNPPYTLFRKRA